MSDSSFIEDAYCGLYCKACPVYQATERGESEILCKGCKSDTVTGEWCKTCNLKKCAREKGLEFCYLCHEYPCEDLENFKNDPQYPYHSEVYDYMATIKQEGKEAWLKEMEKRWSCPSCSTRFDWWTQKCTKCGEKTNGYAQPEQNVK